MADQHILKWLREEGGSRNAAVNGSSTPVLFEYTSTEDTVEVARLIISIVDSGTFDAEKYGNGLVLTNGIKLEVINSEGGVVLDLLDGEEIKTNADWQAMCFDFHYNDIGTGDNVAVMRWTFERAGEPLLLPEGSKLRITVQDNLTGLTAHYFQLQGIQY